MDPDAAPPEPAFAGSSLSIGNVFGGIRDSFIAGRDIILHKHDDTADRRAANTLRARVREEWIEGILTESLLTGPMMRPALTRRPEFVTGRSTRKHAAKPADAGYLLDPPDLEADSGRSVLILGEAGAGKTTLLLDTARQWLETGGPAAGHFVPVVLQLAAWRPMPDGLIAMARAKLGFRGTDRSPFESWLIAEVHRRYRIPKRTVVGWIDDNRLALFLDGIDEVPSGLQADLVEDLNRFLGDHMLPTFATARLGDYQALHARLHTDDAVVLQPLSIEQIDAYLATGEDQRTLRDLLAADPELRAIAASPLMLGVLTAAQLGREPRDLSSSSLAEKRGWAFQKYTQAMIARVGIRDTGVAVDLLRFLRRLASLLDRGKKATFRPEDITFSALSGRRERYVFIPLYAALVVSALATCYAAAPRTATTIAGFALGADWHPSNLVATVFGIGFRLLLIAGFVGVLLAYMFAGLEIQFHPLRWSPRRAAIGALTGAGTVAFVSIGVAAIFGFELGAAWICVVAPRMVFLILLGVVALILVVVAVAAAIANGSFGPLASAPITFCIMAAAPSIYWNLGNFIIGLESVPDFSNPAVGLISTLEWRHVTAFYFNPFDLLIKRQALNGHSIPMFVLLHGGLIMGCFALGAASLGAAGAGFVVKPRKDDKGHHHMPLGALGAAGIVGATTTLSLIGVVLLMRAVAGGPLQVWDTYRDLCIFLGVVAFWGSGGLPVVNYALLRVALTCGGEVPLRLGKSLGIATRMNLIRRIGAEYMFLHLLERDFFASLDAAPLFRLAGEAVQRGPD